MSLDLTTIAAQIVNFLILIALLNRFLYRPVTQMMETREDRVRRRLEEAEALENEAKAQIAAYQARQAEFAQERARLMEEARAQARQERTRLLEEAAKDAQDARQRFSQALAAERTELEETIQEALIRRVCETSGYVVSELAGLTLEDAVIATLEKRWEEYVRESREPSPAKPYVETSSILQRAVEVRTSFEPTDQQRARLTALAERIGAHDVTGDESSSPPPPAEIHFRVDPELLLGIEIQRGGTAISWTARDVLDDLQKNALAAIVPAGQGDVGQRPGNAADHEGRSAESEAVEAPATGEVSG